MVLGGNIARMRCERNVTIAALAEAIGVSELAIEQYEQGRWRPGMDVLVKLAEYFGVTVADVVGNCHIVNDDINGAQIILRNTNGNSIQVVGKLCCKDSKTA